MRSKSMRHARLSLAALLVLFVANAAPAQTGEGVATGVTAAAIEAGLADLQ